MILSAIYIENHFLFEKPLIINFGGKYLFSIDEFGKISKENQELTSLRDWFLPMLMNGQVSVASRASATEEQLGMVAEDNVEYKKG